jgi:hypothetical protein
MTVLVSVRTVDEVNQQSREALQHALADLAGRRLQLTRFAITASQTWFDWRLMWSALALVPTTAVMFNGMANGGDCLARSFWWNQGGEVRRFWAKWNLGRGAGLTRNTIMLENMPQLVLAFLRHDLPSPGTRHAIAGAQQRGIPVFSFHQFVTAEWSAATDPRDPDRRRVSR